MNDNIYQSNFNFKTFVIGYYLTDQIKKLRFVTDGTFESINIIFGRTSKAVEFIDKALTYYEVIDLSIYNQFDDDNKCLYVLKLIKEAIIKISKVKIIPLDVIIKDCDELIKSRFVYHWRFCNLKISNGNLKIQFNSELNPKEYLLTAAIYKDSENKPIYTGLVIRTKPDDLFFSFISKKIQQKNGQLIFTTKWDVPLFYLNVSDLNKGLIKTMFFSSPYPEDLKATENFLQLQSGLKYFN